MTQDLIPAPIRKFALDHVDSIAHMEALLILWRDPSAVWAVEQVAQRLYIPGGEAAGVLLRLEQLGLAQQHGGAYRYAPASAAMAAHVDALAALYSTHLIPVTNLIHSRRDSRVQEFADAFKLRKKGDRS
ncbi:hypothetical protein OOT46_30380 [Aquabacterium sp. A7-Y]|uniref:hypothetical protein n=1 Tax=Aquabacterium sp. A7-Y TaxID=1349605 RepID=UPI00223DDD47|nr:hypothetical protein [Aquabacterium sp. A7-Y]MCW7542106.1 hypothetical protein [Aquabacterium sp. A7-Y]